MLRHLTSALCLALTPAATLLHAQAPAPREHILFDAGWRFQKGDPSGTDSTALAYVALKPWLLPMAAAFVTAPALRPAGPAPGESLAVIQPAFNDSGWRTLDLPQDWGIEGPFNQTLPGETAKLPWAGIAWYRKTFELPASDRGRIVTLQIDGAMAYSAVWCNGHFVGGWPYGYSSYQLDLTPYLKPGALNTLAIRLDNPKDSSRWYPGGGIYRDVWLITTSLVHVAQWGTAVTTPEVTPDSATIAISADITNTSPVATSVRVSTQLFKADAFGHPTGSTLVASCPESLALPAGATQSVAATLNLAHPVLWGLEHPERYVAITLIQQDGRIVDRYETPFGIRTAVFTADGGFFLNGKHVPLQGVCRHADLGALGTAFNFSAAERQLRILKSMGVNAIRTSHNPPDPRFLDLCDRMGILVMDEFVDCWKIPKKPNGYNLLFDDWSEADIRSYVRRDRNHPCVILWSIGNEIPEQSRPQGPAMGKRLSRLVHLEDPTRPTTFACSYAGGGYNGYETAVDVFGYNYHPGEYAKFHATHPNQPLFGSETASTISSRGEYLFPVTNNKSGGKIGHFQMSSYDLYAPGWATTPDTEFKGQDENPFVAGEFIWTGFDYLGEPTPYNGDITHLLNYNTPGEKAAAEAEFKKFGKLIVPSRSSYFGAIDLAGFPKDRFYLYQSRWRPDLPMAHILPQNWNWPDRVGQVTPVFVYTSGDEAELFLNGKSLGRKKKGRYEYRLCWNNVIYQPGELKVVAYKNGKEWATDTVKTTGAAAKLLLSPDCSSIITDGRDLAFVKTTVADADGLMVPIAQNTLTYTLTGPGEIVATDNGDPTDLTTFSSPRRHAFNGLAIAIVRFKPGATTPIVLRVTAEGLAPAEVTITPIE